MGMDKIRMPMKLIFTSYWIALFSLFTSLGSAAGSDGLKPLVEANTAFALQMYGELRSSEGNLVFSPYSISSALAMVYAGAREETARQMAQTLHFDQCPADVHALFHGLDRSLALAACSNELEIANSLWPQQGYPFRKEFLSLLKKDYGATVTPQDYMHASEGARNAINQWVDDKTRHKISEIIGPGVLDAHTRLVLVNAIYFNGKWATPFPVEATHTDNFQVKPGKTITASFMSKSDHFSYGENDQLQLLSLPYAGGKLELTILLPRDQDGISDLETNLSPANLAEWIGSLRPQLVNVMLPKFKMSAALELNETLEAMGMKDSFSPAKADFSGMDNNPHWLYISAVLHKAYIDVNEKGTEAAAATAVVWAENMAMPVMEKSREFRADHPFLFLLRETSTGSILFIGRASEPKTE
jgi:serpin B